MSGSGGDRDDRRSASDNPVGGGEVDPCRKVRRGPINSPKLPVLGALTVGSVMTVAVQMSGATPVLVVKDGTGNVGGSLTFIGYLDIIDCIQNRAVSYMATIVSISGGIYEVRVEAL